MAFVIGAATIVEACKGTPFVLDKIYGTPWFYALWCAIAVSAVCAIALARLWKRFAVFMLHVSFLVILAGALATALTGKRGLLHLYQDQPASSFALRDGQTERFPFVITLKEFKVEHYPGTTAHSDYVSRLVYKTSSMERPAEATVSMNRICRIEGYRLYQSSYDEDMRGSWLSVNYDPYGTPLTYTGYALLALSMLLVLLTRAGRLKALLSHPALRRSAMAAAWLLLLLPSAAEAKRQPVPAIRVEEAETYKTKQIIYNDRVAPLNTLASDFVRKITGKRSFGGLTAEQVMISWMLAPEQWQHVEMIKVKSKELRRTLGITTEYARFEDFFDAQGRYRLDSLYRREQGTRSKMEKAIGEADEKVGIILMLTQGELIKPVPADGSVPRLSNAKVRAELLYNAVPFSQILFMANLTVGLLLFGLMMGRMLRPPSNADQAPRGVAARLSSWAFKAAPPLLFASTLVQLAAFLLRWYVSGTFPLTNGYETMQFVSLATLLIACALHRRLPFLMPFGFLLSGFTLLVSHLGEMNPQITPLMPVLQSQWLSSHVSLIMMSYSLYAFMAMNGLVSLFLLSRKGHSGQAQAFTLVSRIMLYPATFFLAVGIFLGAVWANVSWGSYWSWDPKEVWALVTMMVYSLAFHTRALPFLRSDKGFSLFAVLAFLTVLMTYFGVNYVLGGMHSYAG